MKDIRVQNSEPTFTFELHGVALEFDDAKRLNAADIRSDCQSRGGMEWSAFLTSNLTVEECSPCALEEIPGTVISTAPHELVMLGRKWVVMYATVVVELTVADICEDPLLIENVSEALRCWDWSRI